MGMLNNFSKKVSNDKIQNGSGRFRLIESGYDIIDKYPKIKESLSRPNEYTNMIGEGGVSSEPIEGFLKGVTYSAGIRVDEDLKIGLNQIITELNSKGDGSILMPEIIDIAKGTSSIGKSVDYAIALNDEDGDTEGYLVISNGKVYSVSEDGFKEAEALIAVRELLSCFNKEVTQHFEHCKNPKIATAPFGGKNTFLVMPEEENEAYVAVYEKVK